MSAAAAHAAHTDRLNAAFAALADPTRRAILARLARGQAPVGELTEPFTISAPAISRHLRVLEHAGLIEREVDARWRICHLRPQGLQAAHDWLAQYRAYWEAGLDRLAELLEHPGRASAAEPQKPARMRRTSSQARSRAHGPRAAASKRTQRRS